MLTSSPSLILLLKCKLNFYDAFKKFGIEISLHVCMFIDMNFLKKSINIFVFVVCDLEKRGYEDSEMERIFQEIITINR